MSYQPWYAELELNQRLPVCETGALPTELSALEEQEPQRGIEPLFPAWKAGASGHSATGAFQLQSAWEESNLRAPAYQAGAWTGSATGGKSGGADSNRLLGGHSPALYLVSYAPACCQWGSRSVSIRRTPAYEAGALPSELQEQGIPPEGIEPSRARAHDVLSVARMRFATAVYMALAGIEPAPRWSSPSRSTGEL